MDELQNIEAQIPDDINVLRKTVEDLRRREQQLLKNKEQSEIEFGKKRAKFRELYMAREEELASEKTRSKTLQQEARELKNELQKVISETDGYRAAAELSERTQSEELESIHKKYQEEIASLRHIMSEDVREANEHLRKEFEADKHHLMVRNQKLEKEVATMKSLLNSDADGSRPRMLSGLSDAVTNVIRRNTTSSQSSTSDEETKTEDALSLERSMKKAQEDAEAWRSIVMPLEEELSSLKVKFKDLQEKLLIAEAKIKEGENKRSDKRAEKEGPFSREQFEELQEKVKELNQYLEGERSARTDLEMYVAVLNTQKDLHIVDQHERKRLLVSGVLQEDAEKLRKELHNVCRLLEQEKMEHRELKQTWQMANEQFVENLRSQGESFQRVWNVLTADQRKVLVQQQGEPDVGQLIDLQSPQTSPQPTTPKPGTHQRMVPVVSSSSMWDNIPTVPCTNELAPHPENDDKEVVLNTEENQTFLRRIHSASDIASCNVSGGEMSRTRSAEELLSVSPTPVSSPGNISTPLHGSELHISDFTSSSDLEARPRVVSKGASGKFDWKIFQEAVKFSHESDMNRSCAMCVNYERQLQRVQDENQKFQNLASNLQIALDQEKKELFKEQKMRSRLEESVAHAAEDAQTRINSHASTNNKLEKLLVGLRENFEATKHEAGTQIVKLVAIRDQLTQELMQLRTDYGALQNNAIQQLSQMDMDARLAEMHEQLLQIRAASESTEERLRSEVAFLKDRAIAEQVAKESLEEMLQSDMDNLKDEIGILKAELEKERKGKEEVELQFRKSDQTLRSVEGKSKQVIIALREQLVSANDEKGKFEGENKRLKNQLQSMTEQLNQSEAVQRDFVRLSQSLQMQIAQIQESEAEVRWEHPDDAKECKRCKKNLKSLKEKHHCHHCGKVFCEHCTSKTVLGGGSATPHPVCDSCHASLNKESRSSFFNTNLADGNQR